jgi:hypothetical protein
MHGEDTKAFCAGGKVSIASYVIVVKHWCCGASTRWLHLTVARRDACVLLRIIFVTFTFHAVQDVIDCMSDDKNRIFIMELVLHCSDISNPFKPYALCAKWADLVVEVRTRAWLCFRLPLYVTARVRCVQRGVFHDCGRAHLVCTAALCRVPVARSFDVLIICARAYRSSACRATRRRRWVWRCPPCATATRSASATCKWASSSSSWPRSSSVS